MKNFDTEKGLEDLINDFGFSANKSAYYMANFAHRYMQQKFFNIAIRFIQLCAENYDKHRYDARNEQACKLSKKIMSNLTKDDYYPMDFTNFEEEEC